MRRKVRFGMVGGGRGAFIGAVHRIAAAMDQGIVLVCGAFSSDPQKAKESGADLGLAPARCYENFETMIRNEAILPKNERMEFVSIVTPNQMHFTPAKMALEHGFHVLNDKPATYNLQEAKTLAALVRKKRLLYGLTHNYTGYPLVKEARLLIHSGKLGKIRKIVVEYSQGWLATRLELTGQKQAAWRTDPMRSGATGCMGDIGTHAENLTEYITGLKIHELAADLTTFVPGRKLDDDGSVLLRFKGGAKGILMASQICVGEENNLAIRVYSERGGIEWYQKEPNTLFLKLQNEATQILRTGNAYLSDQAKIATRTPPGLPEGYLEAFANLYRAFAQHVLSINDSQTIKRGELAPEYPTIEDGVRGMLFLEAVLTSSQNNSAWTKLDR